MAGEEKRTFNGDLGLLLEPVQLHPVLTTRMQRVTEIHRQREELPIPNYVPDILLPHPSDQDLRVTPYDDVKDMSVAIPPETAIGGWKTLFIENLTATNSSERITALMRLDTQGFTPPQELDEGTLDRVIRQDTLLQLSDLGQNIGMMAAHRTNGINDIADMIRQLKRTTPEEIANSDDLKNIQKQVEAFKETISAIPQAHRTPLLESGPFSFVGRHARSTVGLGAMPDVNGSVLALTTAARMFMLAEVPEVGVFSDPMKQAALAKATLDNLCDKKDPLFIGKTSEQIAFMLDHRKSSIVGVLEVDPDKALRRAEVLAEVGIQSFRPYGHTRGGDIIKTVELLRKRFPDAEIFASQISDENAALACEAAGADAIIIGVGSGGRCTTAFNGQLIPDNAHLPWLLRGKLGIPIIGEGGAVDEPIIALLSGMSGVLGSGSIAGGTLESPGGAYFLTKNGKTFVKPYGGEASPRTKWLNNRIYKSGLPRVPEGEQNFKALEPLLESMTQRTKNTVDRFILGAVLLGIDAGENTMHEIQNINPSPLWRKSETTLYRQRTH